MPIIKRQDFGTDRAPDWCKIAGGIVGMGCSTRDADGKVELHFHDCEEFWFAIQGKAKVVTDGEEHLVEPGDVVCTHMGQEHAILEVVEPPYQQVWVSCNLRGRMRKGHLHRGEDEPA